MNKLGFLLLAALVSKGALASEVGAPFPQLSNSTALPAVAVAETGASSSLALDVDSDDSATTQHASLNTYVENALNAIAYDYERRLLRNFEYRVAAR